jgi:VWFA-related protein
VDIPTFRRTVAEVQLTFFPTNEQRRTVTDLQAADFVIVDNELVVRNFRSFMRRDLTKVRVVILIDASESVASHYQREVDELLELIARTSWISKDSVSVLAFRGKQVETLCREDCREVSVSRAKLPARADGATPLFDALVSAAEMFPKERDASEMPLMVLFSDGMDTISLRTAVNAVDASASRDLQIYTVDLNSDGRAPEGSATLRALAKATAGRYFAAEGGCVQILAGMLEDLHAAYAVTYVPPDASWGTHSVYIVPTHNVDLNFRYRRSYEYGQIGGT